MHYFKVTDLNGAEIGFANSYDLVYYNEKKKRLLRCEEPLAQYIYVKGSFYRVELFRPESEEIKGKYPQALIESLSKEEFEKQISEQK